jgi:hypothetical protein
MRVLWAARFPERSVSKLVRDTASGHDPVTRPASAAGITAPDQGDDFAGVRKADPSPSVSKAVCLEDFSFRSDWCEQLTLRAAARC